ncbi:MAG: penicillin-binding protein 2 [Planctomycetes bacterium]|nr:penicillin-binding protein 2 [Planctomycetota bacterium]
MLPAPCDEPIAEPTRPSAALVWRTRILAAVVLGLWGVLAARLIQIQWMGHADFSQQASRQQVVYEEIPARPGDILDRDGRVVLATTVSAKSVYVVPSRVRKLEPFAEAVAKALHLDRNQFHARLKRYCKKHFLWAKRRADDEEIEQLRKLDLPARTWGLRDEYVRRYPLGRLAAHVIGLRDIDGRGRSGLERALDPLIGGRPGRRRLARDALGRVIDVQDDWAQPPQRGRAIATTLDIMIQLYAERQLDAVMEKWRPRHAMAIVMVPQTGEILAMATRPTFDPNTPDKVDDDAWLNYAVSAVFEPGSTIKPLIVAWALDRGVVAADETFDCEWGAYRMGRRVLHDHHRYGELSLADVLVKSSNIGMAKIGQRLTNRGLYQALIAFGFGRRTGVELAEEAAGKLRPLDQWDGYSTGSVPMGQEIGVTAIQLIAAYTALANDGRLVRPTFVRFHESEGEQADNWLSRFYLRITGSSPDSPFGPNVVSETVHPDVARWIVQVPLTDVVRRGTGRKAQLDGFTVFGKTGTAQKTDPETGQYSDTKYICSFICGAPADSPRVLVLVVVDEPSVGGPHFGGTVAAPAAAAILRHSLRRLGIPPSPDIATTSPPPRISSER